MLGPGTYTGEENRNVSPEGKLLVICSSDGPENTVIDCEGSPQTIGHQAFVVVNGEDHGLVIQGLTIANASTRAYTTWGQGGAIRVSRSRGPVTVRNCILESGYAEYGGSIFLEFGSLILDSCVFRNNGAWIGGAVFCGPADSVLITACRFDSNYTDFDDGGGLEIVDSRYLLVRNCDFVGNYAESVGGGITAARINNIVMDSSRFTGNSAGNRAGAASVSGTHIAVDSCEIVNNRVSLHGSTCAGMFIGATESGCIRNCLIAGNSAEAWSASIGGLDVTQPDEPLLIQNCTVVGNRARERGGGIRLNGPNAAIIDRCIIAYNSSDHWTSVTSDAVITCTDIYGNIGGDWWSPFMDSISNENGNMSNDPLFCDTSLSDYRLYDNSTCTPQKNECGVLIGSMDIGCAACPAVVVSPNPIPPTPKEPLTLTIGSFTDGYGPNDVDLPSIIINDSIVPRETAAYGALPDFPCGAIVLGFWIMDIEAAYGAVAEETDYPIVVQGEFTDGTPFALDGVVQFYLVYAGDVDDSGEVDGSDLIHLVDFLFAKAELPVDREHADINRDERVDSSDLGSLVTYLF
jgi:hypothetical protein